MSNLISAYLKYKTQRERIKARHRVELENELIPFAVEVGREIDIEKSNSTKIEEISFMIGLRNRSFIYKMWNAYRESQHIEPAPVEIETEDTEYSLTFFPDKRIVTVDFGALGSVSLDLDSDGTVLSVPDEWLNAPKDERKGYFEIIKEIESHGVTEN